MSISRDQLIRFQSGDLVKNFRFQSSDESSSNEIKAVGEGGSGIVFLASQELYDSIRVPRAVKFFIYRDDIQELTKHKNAGPISKNDFLAEIENIASLSHENLLKVVDAGIYLKDGFEIPYLVSEYIDGPTLLQVVEAACEAGNTLNKKLQNNPTLILELLLRVAFGIKHLHDRGFLHCDIAPKNIFLRSNDLLAPVLGDLGIAKTEPKNGSKVFIAGTKSYMPDDVLKYLNTEISWKKFKQLQPNWDLFAFGKTVESVLSILTDQEKPPWYRPLLSMVEAKKYSSINEVIERIEFLLPMQREVANIPELSASIAGKSRKLMPVEALAASRRVQHVIRHPALTRLGLVPQITAAEKIFPGAVHTRYEHSLGVMETVRRYLIALLNQDEFLEHLNVPKIETALVSGLLYNVTRFPLSNIVHEIKSKDSAAFSDFSRTSLLPEISRIKNTKGVSLKNLIERYFPSIRFDDVSRILTGDRPAFSDEDHFIYSLLNSSLDARVVDFVRRDSHHLGIVKGDSFDLDELLPHLTVHQHKLALRSTGVSVAEQIISLRYWLFQRVYWSRPNRVFCTMLKEVLLTLSSNVSFVKSLRAKILNCEQRELIKFLRRQAQINNETAAQNICELLLNPDQELYRIAFDVSTAEDSTIKSAWERLSKMRAKEFRDSTYELSKILSRTISNVPADICLVLMDIPHEPGANKLGEDIVVIRPDKNPVGLDQFSGIVGGVNISFKNHLQRLRVMIHPEAYPAEKTERLKVKTEIYDWLIRCLS